MSFNVESFEKTVIHLFIIASVSVPPDGRVALEAAHDKEASPTGKVELKN